MLNKPMFSIIIFLLHWGKFLNVDMLILPVKNDKLEMLNDVKYCNLVCNLKRQACF